MLTPAIYNYFKQELCTTKGNHLEIGIFDGEGICQLASMFPNKMFYAIDPFIEDGNTMGHSKVSMGEEMSNIKLIALDRINNHNNIKLFQQTSKAFLSELSLDNIQDMNIETVSIDGSHHYNDVKIDIELAVKILNNKMGIIHFDDALQVKDVVNAIAKFESSQYNIIRIRANVGTNQVAFKGIFK